MQISTVGLNIREANQKNKVHYSMYQLVLIVLTTGVFTLYHVYIFRDEFAISGVTTVDRCQLLRKATDSKVLFCGNSSSGTD